MQSPASREQISLWHTEAVANGFPYWILIYDVRGDRDVPIRPSDEPLEELLEQMESHPDICKIIWWFITDIPLDKQLPEDLW